MNELALFAGVGGGILGGHLLGWRTVCAVELNPFCRRVLMQRQNDRLLPPFPIWDDINTFDGNPWRGTVDVVSGGFPCQDISAAGKGAGIDGPKSGLWSEMARIIFEVRPRFVFVENSPVLTSRGLGRVLGDLAAMGFDARWGIISAADVGAPHLRKRLWILANATGARCPQGQSESSGKIRNETWGAESQRRSGEVADSAGKGFENIQGQCSAAEPSGWCKPESITWWDVEPPLGRVANGIPHRVGQLRALGNAQVPGVAATAWRMLK